jgi:hypothetical protein
VQFLTNVLPAHLTTRCSYYLKWIYVACTTPIDIHLDALNLLVLVAAHGYSYRYNNMFNLMLDDLAPIIKKNDRIST